MGICLNIKPLIAINSKTTKNSFSERSTFDKEKDWLPDKDSNLDKLIQNQLCYRYTIGNYAMRSINLCHENKMSSRFFDFLQGCSPASMQCAPALLSARWDKRGK